MYFILLLFCYFLLFSEFFRQVLENNKKLEISLVHNLLSSLSPPPPNPDPSNSIILYNVHIDIIFSLYVAYSKQEKHICHLYSF